MEEDVLNALQTRTAYLPGGFDREQRIIFIVNIINDLQLWNRRCLELSIDYLKRALSVSLLQNGVTVIVDAQKSGSRITRTHARTLYTLFGSSDITVELFLVRAEGFWEKHVEPCAKSQTKGEPIVLSKARLTKYFDMHNLPEELGGTLQFNYDLWLQQRKSIDEFSKSYEQTLNAMENLHVLLVANKALRPTEADAELKRCAQLHANVQQSIESAIELGNRILARLNEVYEQPPSPAQTPTTATTATKSTATATATEDVNAPAIQPKMTVNVMPSMIATNTASKTTTTTTIATTTKHSLPPDLCCERARIEQRLNEIEKKQTEIRTAWLELLRSIREARELSTLEEGVAFVTNWILNTAEQMLGRQQSIGGDVRTCESLRSAHDALELECRETYGFYAELLYKIDAFAGARDNYAYKDLMSQRDFMHFVCRSFATRLERRRNVLITALRFYRLVTEYFERTTEVFENLVMGASKTCRKVQRAEDGDEQEAVEVDFAQAANNLQMLQDSQANLVNLERELVREGEKLSDILAMPVKDALGRDRAVDYSDDIANIRDILDTTMARRKIFSDSVELQKLTLQQVTHIHTYEEDARMALKWMNDLYAVMIRCHSHVGCNIHEIQVQKDELQSFQETGKSIYNYGCQLLEASQALRVSCKLDLCATLSMSAQLQRTWHSLQAISQEHMTRLRVSAVFHRSVEEYSQQLLDLKATLTRDFVAQLQRLPQHCSSSGISSDISPTPNSQTQQQQRQLNANAEPTTTTLPDEQQRRTQQQQLRRHLMTREQLLVEVGRMVRLGRLLKTRLKEPFVLDANTGKSVVIDDLPEDSASPLNVSVRSGSVSVSGSGSSSCHDDSNSQHAIEGADDSGDVPKAPNEQVAATVTAPATVVVTPTGNNAMACNAIANKLSDIAEVAESLDAVIRDIQQNGESTNETNTHAAHDKKLANLRSSSSEDWQSRSTEDESFVTASEGNFTPHSHSSSSFQTASGRTSSYIGSAKDSFDASEADDSTFGAFEIPELPNSPVLNMSYDGSEQSYFSAQQQSPSQAAQAIAAHIDDDQDSVVGVEDLHSQSVTPTPEQQQLQQHQNLLTPPYESHAIESETELEIAGIADAPSMEILTELAPNQIHSVTPEVSQCDNTLDNNNTNANANTNSNANAKPNAAWRRSKYYENITKQTIKGFL